MVGMNPHVGDVVIENLAYFVDNSGGQLRGNFGTRDPAADAFYFALINKRNTLEFLSILLANNDLTAAERRIASLFDFDRKASGLELR